MILSKTSQYAIRVLSYMINSDLQVFSAHHLIKTLGIPDKYLRQLLTNLSKAGFIKSIRGRDGGYVFARNANRIYLSEIIDAVDGMDKYHKCLLGFSECDDGHPCSLHEKWAPLREKLLAFINNTTLIEVKNNQIEKF